LNPRSSSHECGRAKINALIVCCEGDHFKRGERTKATVRKDSYDNATVSTDGGQTIVHSGSIGVCVLA